LFIKEAGLPPDAGSQTSKNDLTIEQILEEKKVFDLSVQFEKLGDEGVKGWGSKGGFSREVTLRSQDERLTNPSSCCIRDGSFTSLTLECALRVCHVS